MRAALPRRPAALAALAFLLAVPLAADDAGRTDPGFPPDWRPEGIGGAREVVVGPGEAELVLDVGGVEVSAPRDFTCRIGVREELPLILNRRGEGEKQVRITGRGPRGVSLDRTDVTMTRRSLGRVTPAVQTLLTRDTHVLLDIEVGKETGSLPVHLVPERAYPIFAVDVGSAAVPDPTRALLGALDIPCTYLHVPPDGPWLELARSAPDYAPRLVMDASLAAPDGAAPAREHLAALAREHRTTTDFWQLRMSLPLPAAGGEVEVEQAVAVAERAAAASGALREGNPNAVVLAPPVPTWGESDAPAALWLAFLLGSDVRPGVQGHTVVHAPPAVPGSEAEAWAELDRAADLSAVQATFRSAGAGFPVWWTRVGSEQGQERLEALRAVRDFALAASTGVFGLEWRPLVGPASAGGLWSPDAGVNEIGAALGEAIAELAGAASCHGWTQGRGDCSWEAGSPITFRSFFRGDEGIVFLWSNLSRRVDVRLGVRQEPLGIRTVIFSPEGRFIRRDTDLKFVAEQRPVDKAYLVERALAPLEIRIYILPLRSAHRAWLADVTAKD